MTIESASTKALTALSRARAHQYLTCCVPYSIDCLLPTQLELEEKWYFQAQTSHQHRDYYSRGGVPLYDVLQELDCRDIAVEDYRFNMKRGVSKTRGIIEMVETIRRKLTRGTYGVLFNESYYSHSGDIDGGHVYSAGVRINRRGKIEHFDTMHFATRKMSKLTALVSFARENVDLQDASVFILRRRRL